MCDIQELKNPGLVGPLSQSFVFHLEHLSTCGVLVIYFCSLYDCRYKAKQGRDFAPEEVRATGQANALHVTCHSLVFPITCHKHFASLSRSMRNFLACPMQTTAAAMPAAICGKAAMLRKTYVSFVSVALPLPEVHLMDVTLLHCFREKGSAKPKQAYRESNYESDTHAVPLGIARVASTLKLLPLLLAIAVDLSMHTM